MRPAEQTVRLRYLLRPPGPYDSNGFRDELLRRQYVSVRLRRTWVPTIEPWALIAAAWSVEACSKPAISITGYVWALAAAKGNAAPAATSHQLQRIDRFLI